LDRLRDKYLYLSRKDLSSKIQKTYKDSYSCIGNSDLDIKFPADVIGIKGFEITIEKVTELKTEGDIEIQVDWMYDIGHTSLS